MTKLYYPQISLEDYQIFRKFMLPGEFPETHDQWVERIERSKRKDTVECLTYEGARDVEVKPDAFKKYCSDTGSKPTRHTLQSSSVNKLDLWGLVNPAGRWQPSGRSPQQTLGGD